MSTSPVQDPSHAEIATQLRSAILGKSPQDIRLHHLPIDIIELIFSFDPNSLRSFSLKSFSSDESKNFEIQKIALSIFDNPYSSRLKELIKWLISEAPNDDLKNNLEIRFCNDKKVGFFYEEEIDYIIELLNQLSDDDLSDLLIKLKESEQSLKPELREPELSCFFKNVIDLCKKNKELDIAKGLICATLELPDKSVRIVKNFLKDQDKQTIKSSVGLLKNISHALSKHGFLKEALEVADCIPLDPILKFNHTSDAIRSLLIEKYIDRDDYEGALSEIEKLTNKGEKSWKENHGILDDKTRSNFLARVGEHNEDTRPTLHQLIESVSSVVGSLFPQILPY